MTVTATNGGGSTSRTSLPTSQVKRLRPVNIARPVISGTPQAGATLSTNTGEWDNVPADYTHAWKRCTTILLATCTTIDGADAASYTLTAQDAGTYIRAYVTAANSGGSNTAYTYPTSRITGAAA